MSTSIETLQRRIGYGGKKGHIAARRLRRIDRKYSTDREECRRFFQIADEARRSKR